LLIGSFNTHQFGAFDAVFKGGVVHFIAVCFGFIFSLSYHYGYFFSADIKSHVLTFHDILYNYYLWIPLFSVVIFGIIMDYSQMFKFPYIEKFLLFLAFTPLLYFMVRNKLSVAILVAMFVVLYIVSQYKKKDKGQYLRKFIASILAITLAAYAMGYYDYKASVDEPDNKALIYMASNPQQAIEANLLLYLDRGLLIKQIDNQNIELLTWQRIDSIDLISQSLANLHSPT
jgi:hypothetical protein